MKRLLTLKNLFVVLMVLCVQLAATAQDQSAATKAIPCQETETVLKTLPRKSSKRAKILKKPDPKYTDKARKNKVQGIVTLEAVFRCDGTVTDISVVKGLPDGLTEVSIEAARKIKFRPATINGEPVSLRMLVQYWFSFY